MRPITLLNVVAVFGFFLLAMLQTPEGARGQRPAPDQAAKKFLGTWKGVMKSPELSETSDVR